MCKNWFIFTTGFGLVVFAVGYILSLKWTRPSFFFFPLWLCDVCFTHWDVIMTFRACLGVTYKCIVLLSFLRNFFFFMSKQLFSCCCLFVCLFLNLGAIKQSHCVMPWGTQQLAVDYENNMDDLYHCPCSPPPPAVAISSTVSIRCCKLFAESCANVYHLFKLLINIY